MMLRAFALAAILSVPLTGAAATRLLALPVVAEGVDAGTVSDIQASLDDALSGIVGLSRVPASGPTFCSATDARCIADAGTRAGADSVLHVSARPVGETVALLLVLVEGGNTRKVTEALQPGVRPGPRVRSSVVRLVAPQRWVGALAVEAREGSQLWVDGEPRAVTPSAPIQNLSPGLHLLRVARGDGEARSYVEIRFDEVTRVKIEPHSDQVSVVGFGPSVELPVAAKAPPLAVSASSSSSGPSSPALLRYGLLGAGAVAIVAGVLVAAQGQRLGDAHDALRRGDGTYADPGHAADLLGSYQGHGTASTGLYIAGAALAAGGGLLFLF